MILRAREAHGSLPYYIIEKNALFVNRPAGVFMYKLLDRMAPVMYNQIKNEPKRKRSLPG